MKWVVVVVRTLVGLMFLVFGVNGLLPQPFIEPPKDGMPEQAMTYIVLLVSTHYLTAVKVLEVLGGAFLLTGRLAPLGITLVMPVAVNVLLYEAFLLKQPGPGCVLVPLLVFLIWGYWPYFAAVFTTAARVRGRG